MEASGRVYVSGSLTSYMGVTKVRFMTVHSNLCHTLSGLHIFIFMSDLFLPPYILPGCIELIPRQQFIPSQSGLLNLGRSTGARSSDG